MISIITIVAIYLSVRVVPRVRKKEVGKTWIRN